MTDHPTTDDRCPRCGSPDPAVRSYSTVTEWDCDGPFHDHDHPTTDDDLIAHLTDTHVCPDGSCERAAARIRELEAKLAEAHADIVMLDGQVRELQALGNALADVVYWKISAIERDAALDAWRNR